MLAACLDVPTNDAEWQNWAWNAWDKINEIRSAVKVTHGISLTEYILIPFTPTLQWLQNTASAHSDFCSILGVSGHNLQELDFSKPDDVASWVNLAYQDLFSASSVLGI